MSEIMWNHSPKSFLIIFLMLWGRGREEEHCHKIKSCWYFFFIIMVLDSIVIWRIRKKQYKCNRQKKMKRKSWKSAQKIYSDVFLDIIVYRGSLWRFYLTWYLCMLFLSKTRDIDEYMTMIFKWSFSLALNQQMIFLDIQQLIIFLKGLN